MQLPLSPIDHVFVGRDSYSVEFMMVFDYRLDAERLRSALEKTSQLFWPVNADLVLNSVNQYEFHRNSRPCDFKVQEGGASVPQFENPQNLTGLTEPVHSLSGERLAKFRLTYFGSKSIFVVNLSHALVDGYSYFFFLATVVANYRYRPWQSAYWKTKFVKPDLDRRKLCLETPSVRPSLSPVSREDFFMRTGFSYAHDQERKLPSLAQSRWEFVRFTPSQLAGHLASVDSHSKDRLSKHDIITALLWKKVAQEWHTANDAMECSSAFDYRRAHGGLSPLYWGNAVRGTVTRMDRNQILESDLGSLAAKIRQATRCIDRNAVLDSLKCIDDLRCMHGPNIFRFAHVSHPKVGLLVTNLSRIDSQRLDFGHGAPTHVIPLTAAPRAAILLSDGEDIVARLGLP